MKLSKQTPLDIDDHISKDLAQYLFLEEEKMDTVKENISETNNV